MGRDRKPRMTPQRDRTRSVAAKQRTKNRREARRTKHATR